MYGGGGGANAGELYRIDPATGTSTLFSATGIGTISGLALRDLSGLLGSSVTVIIPAGVASVDVELGPVQDYLVDGDQIAKVVAYAPRHASGEDTLAVTDSLETLSLTLTIDGPTVFAESAGPAASSATVTLSHALTAPLDVNLVSHDLSEAAVPALVTIAAGQTTASFFIDAVDDAVLDGNRTVRHHSLCRADSQ